MKRIFFIIADFDLKIPKPPDRKITDQDLENFGATLFGLGLLGVILLVIFV